MIRAFRRWLTFLLEVRSAPPPRPLLGRFDADVDRYLQRRAAQVARRHPHTPPARRRGPANQEGFQ